MKVTGTYVHNTYVHPCPPLPVMHTPNRKSKSDHKHRDWRVNPMARTTQQQDNRTTNTSSSPGACPSHSSDRFGESSNSSSTSSTSSSTSSYQQNSSRITLEKQKFNGVRKVQYSSMNAKFANLTMALNTAYQKTQVQAEKRLKNEKTLKEKSGQIISC